MKSRRFLILLLLGALLGVGLWVWDKERKGFFDRGPDEPAPRVVDRNDPRSSELPEDAEGDPRDARFEPGSADELASSPTTGLLPLIPGTQPGTGSALDLLDPFGEAIPLTSTDEKVPGLFGVNTPGLQSFDAYVTDKGVILEWMSGEEEAALGYRISRVAADGTETPLTKTITAADGDGTLYKLSEPGKEDGGMYVIDRIGSDLEATRLPVTATARLTAPPEDGLHVVMIQAEGGEAEVDLGTDPRNLFIIGFKQPPEVHDLSDPDSPRLLDGEPIILKGEQAIYFRAESFSRIHVKNP